MLILILIDIQFSKKAGFRFEKDLNCQSHSSPGSHHTVKVPLSKISDPPYWGGFHNPLMVLYFRAETWLCVCITYVMCNQPFLGSAPFILL